MEKKQEKICQKASVPSNSKVEKELSKRNHQHTIVQNTPKEGLEQFTCQVCYEKFALRLHLIIHIKKVHKGKAMKLSYNVLKTSNLKKNSKPWKTSETLKTRKTF